MLHNTHASQHYSAFIIFITCDPNILEKFLSLSMRLIWTDITIILSSLLTLVTGVGSLALVYQWVPTELPIQVLGFWMWWLFIIPSLR